MGNIILKKIKCVSTCTYNNEVFEYDLTDFNPQDYKLKIKDIRAITNIIEKRESKIKIKTSVKIKHTEI